MRPINIPELFGEVVKRTSANMTFCNPYIKEVHYVFGNPKEVAMVLINDFEQQIYDKYPLIILFTDIPETRGEPGYWGTISPHIVIVHDTEHNYRAADRIEKVFKPNLYPIKDEFIKQIDLYTQGMWKPFDTGYGVDDIKYTQIDRLYWGASEDNNNPFNDRLDAIELKFNNLKIYERNC